MDKCKICGEVHAKGACLMTSTVVDLTLEQLIDAQDEQAAGSIATPPQRKIYLSAPAIPEHLAVAYLEEPALGKRFPIPLPQCSVGRSDLVDLVIAGEESVSRSHFSINCEKGKFVLVDNRSTNGTFLNGAKIHRPTPLENGDRIRAGRFCLIFYISKNFPVHGIVSVANLPQPSPRPFDRKAPDGLASEPDTYDLIMAKAERAAIEMALKSGKPTTEQKKVDEPAVSPPAKPVAPAIQATAQTDTQANVPNPGSSLSKLETELSELHKQSEHLQQRIGECKDRIKAASSVDLDSDLFELIGASAKLFERFAWEVRPPAQSALELLLERDGRTEGIVRVALGDTQTALQELGKLLHSQVQHWTSKSPEPKGVLIFHLATSAGSSEGSQVRIPIELERCARQKKVCILTVNQLFGMYQSVLLDRSAAPTIRKAILSTDGSPVGFDVD